MKINNKFLYIILVFIMLYSCEEKTRIRFKTEVISFKHYDTEFILGETKEINFDLVSRFERITSFQNSDCIGIETFMRNLDTIDLEGKDVIQFFIFKDSILIGYEFSTKEFDNKCLNFKMNYDSLILRKNSKFSDQNISYINFYDD